MFGHIFIHQLKILLKSKAMIFWTLIFPIVLATFFNMAFANLTSDETFKAIDIAIVNDHNYQKEENFQKMIKEIDQEIFNIKYVKTEEEASRELSDNRISGYYIVKDQINIVVKANGIDQTIMKYVIDNYYQTIKIIENIYHFNPQDFKLELVSNLNDNANYFKDKSNENIDFTVIYFYTLIGMFCIYAGFFGINLTNDTEANLSKRAARISMAPTHKLKILLISLLVTFIVQYIEFLILLIYLIFILGIKFGNQLPLIILLTLIGSITGISFGVLVGVSNKKSERTKTAILLSITMTCSFLAGMMIFQMKYIVEENIPIINKINPVAIITDALYSLYYYDTLDRYFFDIINLVILSIIAISISYIFVRRKKYDSI